MKLNTFIISNIIQKTKSGEAGKLLRVLQRPIGCSKFSKRVDFGRTLTTLTRSPGTSDHTGGIFIIDKTENTFLNAFQKILRRKLKIFGTSLRGGCFFNVHTNFSTLLRPSQHCQIEMYKTHPN